MSWIKKISRKQLIIIISLVLFYGGFSIIQITFMRNSYYTRYYNFYSTNVKGVIKRVEAENSGTFMDMQNKIEYSFLAKDPDYFIKIAARGDSAIKPAFSDTLTIITKEGKKHFITFYKINKKTYEEY
jgi:hypothetical protein